MLTPGLWQCAHVAVSKALSSAKQHPILFQTIGKDSRVFLFFCVVMVSVASDHFTVCFACFLFHFTRVAMATCFSLSYGTLVYGPLSMIKDRCRGGEGAGAQWLPGHWRSFQWTAQPPGLSPSRGRGDRISGSEANCNIVHMA